MPNEQENIDEQIIRDWVEMKKLQHPGYWTQMKDKLQIAIRRKHKIRIVKYAAIFMLPILACGLYLLLDNPHHTPPRTEQTLAKILPGDKKAILYTSDGSSLVLSEDTLSLTEINGTRILSAKDEGIVYTPQTTSNTIEIYNTLVVPLKGEYNITLCDGTQVWLNSFSSLKYPVIFSDSVREVHLEGEAFFIVTDNKEKPFIVTTKDYSVKVLGTAFNVMAYNDDNYSHTTLAKGKIEILHGDKRQILIPGEQAVLKDGKISIKKVDPHYYTTWMNDRFYFDSECLENIMKKLSRWYDVQVTFKDEAAKQYHFEGSVPKYSSIKEICNIIELTTHVRFELEKNNIIVKLKE
ncbi:FecR family protein [Butyricimonas hominis]|jgi:fecR protein|uniref:FecR family protein n=1 Tax=Butyricimonas hominis TaxID=2763032 RepID=A0ABR7CXM5_9BACT|nr:FecR family protein [Butyricimonas hominis]MBC5620277.1 FecR family protein [Butyricimonas hominis]